MIKLKYLWHIWAKALGPKAINEDNNSSDLVAIIRTIILFFYLITNIFIIAGVIKHWN